MKRYDSNDACERGIAQVERASEKIMACLAFFTLNVAREPFSHPHMRGFVERVEAILAQASAAPGFVAFAPAMRVEQGDPALVWPAAKPTDHEAAMTLSLWRDVDAVFAFAYRGLHAEALQLRREWTITPEWPNYAAWWVADDDLPTWAEAAERHESLRVHGPTAYAFDFRTPFNAEGQPQPPVRKPLGLIAGAHGSPHGINEHHLIGNDFGAVLPRLPLRAHERPPSGGAAR